MNDSPHNIMHSPLVNQRGVYFVFSVIILIVMFGFAALGIEIGRWYAIEGEIGKSVDGAAFTAAKNVSNPYFTNEDALKVFAIQVAQANFPPGLLGTDTPQFAVTIDANKKVIVDASVNSMNTFVPVVDHSKKTIQIGATGAAKLRKAEIVLVLDVSGSMWDEMGDLRDAAIGFVENFQDIQRDHKMGLISFASGVQVLHPLENMFGIDMTQQISFLRARGWTNSEDALDQAGDFSWSDNSGLSHNERTRQVVIFFSDGDPTAFRGTFKRDSTIFDAVVPKDLVLYDPTDQSRMLLEPDGTKLHSRPTGDGRSIGSSACSGTVPTVKWYIFEDATFGVNGTMATSISGRNAEECGMGYTAIHEYVPEVAPEMAKVHAQELKDAGIEVFTIGLGTAVQASFLQALSSGDEYYYHVDSSDGLAGVFQEIANKLKLVLVS